MKTHPDKGGTKEAFQKINAAWELIQDPKSIKDDMDFEAFFTNFDDKEAFEEFRAQILKTYMEEKDRRMKQPLLTYAEFCELDHEPPSDYSEVSSKLKYLFHV